MKKRREIIEFNLLKLGIAPCLKGFWYIRRAIEILIETDMKTPTCALYKEIAEENNDEANRVERAIRHAITKVDKKAYEEMGGRGYANSEFVSTLALLAKNKLESEE